MAEEIDHLSDAAIALDDTLVPNAASADPITDDIPEDVIEVPVNGPLSPTDPTEGRVGVSQPQGV